MSATPDSEIQPLSNHEMPDHDPLLLFDSWYEQAAQSEPNDPNAVALATATASGVPSVRMVLLKPVTHPEASPAGPAASPAGTAAPIKRFCFFTNVESQKGRELTQNPNAALCFHWKSLRRQVRVAGTITELAPPDVDAYFHSRSRKSQIGAAVSDQSRPLSSREELETKARDFAETHPAEIPRPNYWQGFELHPIQIEFWMDGPDRLHDRFLFTRTNGLWAKTRLYP